MLCLERFAHINFLKTLNEQFLIFLLDRVYPGGPETQNQSQREQPMQQQLIPPFHTKREMKEERR